MDREQIHSLSLSDSARAGGLQARAPQSVVVTDIQMPFWSMVFFMVKWAIAAIPALLIIFMIGALLIGVLGGISK